MKKILMITLACCLTTGAFAQNKMSDSKESKMESKDKMQPKETIELKGEKMMETKGENTRELQENKTLKNGTVVMTDGMLKTKEGKMIQLKAGESVDTKGNISRIKKHKMDNKMKMDKTGSKMKTKM